jgi:Na+-translocating ferredoxin:NAD+ oxidoreductase RnfD subunit
MSTQFLTVSPSPHIHSNDTVQKLMYGVVVSLIPALLISFFRIRPQFIVCNVPVSPVLHGY